MLCQCVAATEAWTNFIYTFIQGRPPPWGVARKRCRGFVWDRYSLQCLLSPPVALQSHTRTCTDLKVFTKLERENCLLYSVWLSNLGDDQKKPNEIDRALTFHSGICISHVRIMDLHRAIWLSEKREKRKNNICNERHRNLLPSIQWMLILSPNPAGLVLPYISICT